MLSSPGRLLTKARLLRAVWGTAYADEGHYLHVYVSRTPAQAGGGRSGKGAAQRSDRRRAGRRLPDRGGPTAPPLVESVVERREAIESPQFLLGPGVRVETWTSQRANSVSPRVVEPSDEELEAALSEVDVAITLVAQRARPSRIRLVGFEACRRAIVEIWRSLTHSSQACCSQIDRPEIAGAVSIIVGPLA